MLLIDSSKGFGNDHKDNVVLFPKTLDYYQIQLTVMLENERYGEAMNLLQFLLQCQGQEERHLQEWQSLLEWLKVAFPQYVESHTEEAEEKQELEELDEEEIARLHVQERLQDDPHYGEKLLNTVMNSPVSEQSMLALSQLSYLESPEIDQALIDWLESSQLHPLLQFRVMQTLRKRGLQGTVNLRRGAETIEAEIESTPLNHQDFPLALVLVLERVADQTEVQEPTLFYFAQELWSQFVMAIYGTKDYKELLLENDTTIDIWAAALHQTVSETLTGSRNDEETRMAYGITDTMRFQFEQAYRTMKGFVSMDMGQ